MVNLTRLSCPMFYLPSVLVRVWLFHSVPSVLDTQRNFATVYIIIIFDESLQNHSHPQRLHRRKKTKTIVIKRQINNNKTYRKIDNKNNSKEIILKQTSPLTPLKIAPPPTHTHKKKEKKEEEEKRRREKRRRRNPNKNKTNSNNPHQK